MTGLHAADTENGDSWLVDVLFVGWTAERTATWTKYRRDRGTCYAATSCTKGALPGEDLVCFAFYYPHCKGAGAFQMYWKETDDSFENYQNCPLNPRNIYYCCRSWTLHNHLWRYSSEADLRESRLSLNCTTHELRKCRR